MIKLIDFKKMINESVKVIKQKKDYLNYINVFPVRDGDTGNNMYLTIQPLIKIKESGLIEFMNKLKKSMLTNAKGNSGVILSQFFKGFCDQIIKVQKFTSEAVKKAFNNGYEQAYQSIGEPIEGTMLTVLRGVCVGAKGVKGSIIDILTSSFKEAKNYLKKTINQLSVLKKSGVVDAGGLGIVYILGAWLKALGIKPLYDKALETQRVIELNEHISEQYCINVLIKDDGHVNELKELLKELGGSLLVAREKNLTRVHIHSNEPETIKELCNSFGKVIEFTKDDMREQHEEIKN